MYTNVPKPTGTPYTSINTAKPAFDEPMLSYDDISTYYDGSNQAAYTNLPKPTDGRMQRAGMTMGLLMPLTRSTNKLVGSAYHNIPKPT